MIEFYFDFASTYSYPAAMQIERRAREAGIEVVWRPFLLAAILRAQGYTDAPFNIYPLKGRHMWRDVQRTCEDLGLQFKRPSTAPRNGILAARVTCQAEGQIWLPEFVRRVYQANFAQDQDIAESSVLAECLSGLVAEPAQWLSAAEMPECKEKLRVNTELATQAGVFGAPSFVVDGELFWGNDRLEQALRWRARANSLQTARVA